MAEASGGREHSGVGVVYAVEGFSGTFMFPRLVLAGLMSVLILMPSQFESLVRLRFFLFMLYCIFVVLYVGVMSVRLGGVLLVGERGWLTEWGPGEYGFGVSTREGHGEYPHASRWGEYPVRP